MPKVNRPAATLKCFPGNDRHWSFSNLIGYLGRLLKAVTGVSGRYRAPLLRGEGFGAGVFFAGNDLANSLLTLENSARLATFVHS